jgi:hypothetical protein
LDVLSQAIWNTEKPNQNHFETMLEIQWNSEYTNITLYRWQKYSDLWICDPSNSKMGVSRADTCSGKHRWSYFCWFARDLRNIMKSSTMEAESVEVLEAK